MILPEAKDYPKKVYITNDIYRIRFVKKFKDPHQFGETDPDTRIIRIKRGMSKREIFNTFIHEIIHALHFSHGFALEHKKVHELEKALAEFLVDNF